VLENYKPQRAQTDDQVTKVPDNEFAQEVPKTEENTSPFVIIEIPTWESIVNAKGGVNLPT
jgi:protein EFR3